MQDNGWALYQDNSWAFGPLDTSQQLHDALELIEESGDGQWAGTMHYRNTAQRSFLAQKAYTRYLYAKVDKLGGMPYLNGLTDRDEAWGKLPRDDDTSRVQYSDQTKMQWGRNPMYSELDDQGDSWTTYPPPGRPGTGIADGGTYAFEDVDWEYVLRDAGILGDDPTKDPDYVAGRFKDVDEWMQYHDPTGTMYFDKVRGTYVYPGEETEHTVFDPETKTYDADHAYYWDDGKGALVQVGDESPGYQWNPETLHFEAPPKTGTAMSELEKDELGITSEDLDAGFGLGQAIDDAGISSFGVTDIPEGYMLDDDGILVYTPDKQAEMDALVAAQVADEAAASARGRPWLNSH